MNLEENRDIKFHETRSIETIESFTTYAFANYRERIFPITDTRVTCACI